MTTKPCAIISVYNKDGIEELAKTLVNAGVDILSTGGTAKHLKSKDIPVTEISAYTGFPEIMDGRVKTLHPRVHAGILARRDKDGDLAALDEVRGRPIDYVIINLYPFIQKARELQDQFNDLLEFIDVGGPSMIRGAAKNFGFVTVVVDPHDYGRIAAEIEANGATSLPMRRYLAAKAFSTLSAYDSVISWVLSQDTGFEVPESFTIPLHLESKLRYGENPHQWGAVYSSDPINGIPIKLKSDKAKEISYNNVLDALSAIGLAMELGKNCCVIVKHNNPCGVAAKASQPESFAAALECDTVSAYGGVIAFKSPITMETAKKIVESKTFLEVLSAPSVGEDVLEYLKKNTKWGGKLRVVEYDPKAIKKGLSVRVFMKVALVQSRDDVVLGDEKLECQTTPADDKTLKDLEFAFAVAKYAKSNAIVIAKDSATLGIGGGQTSRVDSAKLAVERAGEKAKGAVAASDAFFPFVDGLEVLAKAGIKAVVHPGGSIRDNEIIKCAGKNGISLYKTGIRHFLH